MYRSGTSWRSECRRTLLHRQTQGPRSAQGSGRYVEAPYRWKLIEGAGHFPHEERPESFDEELLGWLSDPEPDR